MPAKPGGLRPHEERRNYSRREPQFSSRESFLIVIEGEVTERLYFEKIRADLRLKPALIVHPGFTDPLGLVTAATSMYERDGQGRRVAKGHRSNSDIPSYDHVWVLFDTDVANRQGQLNPALQLAKAEGIHVGHSTPCIETWLFLHFQARPGPLIDSVGARRKLSEAMRQSYSKSAVEFEKLWPTLAQNIPAAVRHAELARQYHVDAMTPFPPDPSTELDLLVRALNAAVQRPLRIL